MLRFVLVLDVFDCKDNDWVLSSGSRVGKQLQRMIEDVNQRRSL